MFKLCRQAFVTGHSGPAIGENFGFIASGVNHWLNGKNHAGFEPHTLASLTIMQNGWRTVKCLAKPMSGKITHHGKPLAFGKRLNGMANITKPVARACSGDAAHQAFIGDLSQACGFDRWCANIKHAGCIAIPAIQNNRNINIQNITIAQCLVAGDAVTDNMIQRNTC